MLNYMIDFKDKFINYSQLPQNVFVESLQLEYNVKYSKIDGWFKHNEETRMLPYLLEEVFYNNNFVLFVYN